MYEAHCAAAVKPRHAVICPHCTERLKIDEDPDNPKPDEPAQGGLNKHGYHPQAGDDVLLARLMFAERSKTPNDYPDVGWATVNRIGAPGFEKTLHGVVFQPLQYSEDFKHKQWRIAGDPSSMDVLDRKSYEIALRLARQILAGAIEDPTNGADYFYSGPKPPIGFFHDRVTSGRLIHSIPSTPDFTFLKEE